MTKPLPDALIHSEVRAVFGAGALEQLGDEAKRGGATHVLLVTDSGILNAGHADRAVKILDSAEIRVTIFSGVEENPTTEHVAAGVACARGARIDFLVGLGGGSSMDCAKGINFILTGGGRMQDYWGVGKAAKPMLPMIAVPTTAGTGSEAQSFALITAPETHQKMACGDKKALSICAILDPDLTRTMPRAVAAATAIDAVSHAIETSACNRRTDESRALSREAWARLAPNIATALRDPSDDDARAHMLLGAHLAGAAIERSMLGAAHACANPLTARYDTVHGVAVGIMLPHVVRFNAADGENPYAELCDDAGELAAQIEAMLEAAGQPKRLRDVGVEDRALSDMAKSAAEQWTARFNPRPVGCDEMLCLYQNAL
jgi:alcohol dehydrogenase